jgi:hypothetical protein
MKKYLLLLLLISVISTETSAQTKTNENYKKTVAFIKSKTNFNTNYVHIEGARVYYMLKINKCVLRTSSSNTPNNWSQSETVNLKDLNPNDTKTGSDVYDQDWVTLKTTSLKNLIRFKSNDTNSNSSDIHIEVKNGNRNNQRVAKAFKWIIEYCGGKDEMY